MNTVEKQDIQGFLLKGYGRMRATRYYLLTVANSQPAKKWLDKISNDISDGNHHPQTTCLNLAFTCPGLKALGLEEENLKDFSREFREGMDTEHRNRLLGDEGANGPQQWEFGANKNNTTNTKCVDTNIHLMLLVFAKDEALLQEYCTQIESDLATHQLNIILDLDGRLLEDNKVHLGFRDGISQPAIQGIDTDGPTDNMVATGEFLMGYKNEYGVYPDTPLINKAQGDVHLLPMDAGGSGKRDLGHNGSYLVYRKMEEEVDVFWKFTNEKTKAADGSVNEAESTKLASKMIGRWPNGAPVTKYPDAPPEGWSDDNDFGYHNSDPDGQKCPFGAHMRRNNPRDAFEDNSPGLSIRLTKKHRIIRRGRSYGEPFISGPSNYTPKEKIGLHFMCFNADIAGQFEFVQHTWANFPKFQSLYNDPDPIIGVRNVSAENPAQNFTIQAAPVNKCVMDLQQFVTIKGGAYFFFPSISAIKYFSTI